MENWSTLPVRFEPESICQKNDAKKWQCIQAARAVYLLRDFKGKGLVTAAVVTTPMHKSPPGKRKDRRNHVTISFVGEGNSHIITQHAYMEDIWAAYGR